MTQLASKSERIPWRWLAVAVSIIIGGLLRHLFLEEMEFKYDEKYMYLAVRKALDGGVWPVLGMHSGAAIRNPGMSIWLFDVLGLFFRVETPLQLCRAVVWLNTAALGLLGLFIVKKIPPQAQLAWWWGLALVTVNPFLVLYQRKIWTVSALPFLMVLFLWTFWERRNWLGAFFWGLLGACLGQIHMSGFFFAFAFVLVGFFHREDRRATRWSTWFVGSVLGSLPLIPWLIYMRTAEGGGVFSLWSLLREMSGLRFWSFWFSDPTGLTLGYFLGLHRGHGALVQNGEFFKYPMIAGSPTYGVTLFILVSLVASLVVYGSSLVAILKKKWHRDRPDYDSDTQRALWSVGGVFGAILPLSLARVRRHYLLITFPFECIWFAREALRGLGERRGQRMLALLALLQLLTSLAFLQFIVKNGGSPQGDYGVSYRVQEEQGTTWSVPIQLDF